MKWNEVFKEENNLDDNGYITLRGAAIFRVFGNQPAKEDAELTDAQEENLVDLLQDIAGWTGKLLERCGCGPVGKVVVEVQGGVIKITSKPDDIVVEIVNND